MISRSWLVIALLIAAVASVCQLWGKHPSSISFRHALVDSFEPVRIFLFLGLYLIANMPLDADAEAVQAELVALRKRVEELSRPPSDGQGGSNEPLLGDGSGSSPGFPAADVRIPPAPSRVEAYHAPKIPAFWMKDPVLWFARVEATFREARITSDATKADHVIASLGEDTLTCCRDLLQVEGVRDLYGQMKKRIITAFSPSAESIRRQLLRGHVPTDGKPSLTLSRLRGKQDIDCSDEIVKSIFLDQLSPSCRSILACVDTIDLEKLAEMADKIYEANESSGNSTFAVKSREPPKGHTTKASDPLQEITSALANLTDKVDRLQQRISRLL